MAHVLEGLQLYEAIAEELAAQREQERKGNADSDLPWLDDSFLDEGTVTAEAAENKAEAEEAEEPFTPTQEKLEAKKHRLEEELEKNRQNTFV